MKRKLPSSKIAVFLLVLLLAVAASGCGGTEPDKGAEAPPSTPATPPPTPPPPTPSPGDDLRITEWRNPYHVEILFREFSEMEWEIGFDGAPLMFRYVLEDVTVMDGRQVHQILLDVDMSALGDDAPAYDVRIWIDMDSGMLGKAELDGEEADDMVIEYLLEGIFGMMFLPFELMDEIHADDILSGTGIGETLGASWSIKSTSTERIGATSATVHTLEVNLPIEVDIDEYVDTVQEWRIADFGAFQMLVGWDASFPGDAAVADDFNISLSVSNVVPR